MSTITQDRNRFPLSLGMLRTPEGRAAWETEFMFQFGLPSPPSAPAPPIPLKDELIPQIHMDVHDIRTYLSKNPRSMMIALVLEKFAEWWKKQANPDLPTAITNFFNDPANQKIFGELDTSAGQKLEDAMKYAKEKMEKFQKLFTEESSPLVQSASVMHPLRTIHYAEMYAEKDQEAVANLRRFVRDFQREISTLDTKKKHLTQSLISAYFMTNDLNTRTYLKNRIEALLPSKLGITVDFPQQGGGEFATVEGRNARGMLDVLKREEFRDVIQVLPVTTEAFLAIIDILYAEIEHLKTSSTSNSVNNEKLENLYNSLNDTLTAKDNDVVTKPQLEKVVEELTRLIQAIYNLIKDDELPANATNGGSLRKRRRMLGGADAPAAAPAKPKITKEDLTNVEKAKRLYREADGIVKALQGAYDKHKNVIYDLYTKGDPSNGIEIDKVSVINDYLSKGGKEYIENIQKQADGFYENMKTARQILTDILEKDPNSQYNQLKLRDLKNVYEGNDMIQDKFIPGVIDDCKKIVAQLKDEFNQARNIADSIISANRKQQDYALEMKRAEQRPSNQPVFVQGSQGPISGSTSSHVDSSKEPKKYEFKKIESILDDDGRDPTKRQFIKMTLEKNDLVGGKSWEVVAEKLSFCQKLASEMFNTVKAQTNSTFASAVSGAPSLFQNLLQQYQRDKIEKDSPFRASQLLAQRMHANDLIPREVLAVTVTDRVIFLFVMLFLRLITLAVTEFFIERGYLIRLPTALTTFLFLYTMVFIAFTALVNIDAYRMRILFNFVNLHAHRSYVISHIGYLWAFSLLIFVIMWNINFPIKGIKVSAIHDEEKIELMYRLEVITMIIWIFLALTIFLT